MRKTLNAAEPGADLRSALSGLKKGLETYLKNGAGFRVRIDGKLPAIERAEGRKLAYKLAGTDIRAEVRIELSKDLGVACQKVTIRNDGASVSPPIQAVEAFYLPLNVLVKDAPRACGMGGGLTNGYYPPAAYREEEVCFGLPRPWEPPNPTFTRWWVAQRFYKLSSGPGGRSSAPHFPAMQIGWKTGKGELGLWAALEWSGRWEIELGFDRDQFFYFRGGPIVKNMVLEPGETIELPAAYIGVFGGPGADREDGFNSVRRFMAESHAPDVEGKRPWAYVAYHHWFGIEHNLTEEILKRQVDRAAELGVEYFEVDAGWYGGATENFANGVGNWERVDQAKFPHGLEPFAEYMKSKGIKFGLWFEPERGRLGSDWVTQHPDFYWKGDGPVNFQLNLTSREVQDYLIETLSNWIRKLDIRWLRWDNNQEQGPYWDRVDPTGKVQFAYMKGLYRVWDTLLERHSNLLIDNCAGGGTRSDFGTLKRAATMVISDHGEDPHVCRIMQTGGARYLPGNFTNSSFYVGEHDGDDLVGPLELMSRMCGALSLSGYISNWSEKQRDRVKHHLDAFRTFRHLLMKNFHPLLPYPRSRDDWDVAEFMDPKSGEAVILAYRMEGQETTRTLKAKRLKPESSYSVIDPLTGKTLSRVKGSTLMKKGVEISLKPHSAAIRHLKPAR